MAGTIIQALPIHRLDFSHVVGGETQQRLLTLRPIDVRNFTEGTLLVRLHRGDPDPLVDGFMERAGTGDWTAVSGAVLTKEGSAYKGSQCLRVAYGGTPIPQARPKTTTLLAGRKYRLRGAGRGDGGSGAPMANLSGNYWWGTTSNTWQTFDIEGATVGTNLYLRNDSSVTGYVEFDALELFPYVAPDHTITIKVFTVSPTREDPHMLYWLEDTAVASVTIDSSTTPPVGDEGTLLKASFSSNFGTSVVIVAEGYRPASPSDLKASISVELALAGRKAS